MRPMLVPTLSALSLLTASAATQDGDDGPLFAPPGLLSVPAAHVQPVGQLLYKQAGFHDGYPGAPQGLIDVSETALLNAPSGVFDVDALSFGLDWILADANGQVPPQTTGWSWAAILFSVEHNVVAGYTRNQKIDDEAGLPDGVGGDLFSLLLRGSRIPGWNPLADHRIDLVVDAPEIDLIRGFQPEMDAYDLPGVLYLLDVPNLPQPARAFFSVTASTADQATSYWGTPAGSASGATIFVSTWNASSRTWSIPAVYRTPASLGLQLDDDIDAVAVDLYHNPEHHILFSLQPGVGSQTTPGPRTGVAFARSGAATSYPYKDQFGNSIGDTVLGRGSNVSAICALDPARDVLLQRMVGTPVAPPPLSLGSTRSSAWLDRDPVRQVDRLQTFLLSEPCPRGVSSSWGVLMLYDPVSMATAGPLPISPSRRGGGRSHHWRGCPARVSYDVPPGLSGSLLPIWLLWADVDPSLVITTPRPVLFVF